MTLTAIRPNDEALSADQSAYLETPFCERLQEAGVRFFISSSGEVLPGISFSAESTDDLIITFSDDGGYPPISLAGPVRATLFVGENSFTVDGINLEQAIRKPTDYFFWAVVKTAQASPDASGNDSVIQADEYLSGLIFTDDLLDVDPDDLREQCMRSFSAW